MQRSWNTDFRSRDSAKNNFSGIDITQGLDLEPPSLSPYFLLVVYSIYKLLNVKTELLVTQLTLKSL